MNRVCLFVLFTTVSLGLDYQPAVSQPPKGGKMQCKLILQKNMVKPDEIPPAEVEIKNISKKEVTVIYNTNVFEHLDLLVVDPTGKKISNAKYGGIFSPQSPVPQQQLSLRPGETYRAKINVFANSKEKDRTKPGAYKITAQFEYDNLKAESEAVLLTIGSK